MKRDEYMRALEATRRIEYPTPQQMLSICPHVRPKQALEALMDLGTIATPPLKIRRSFQVAHHLPGVSTPQPVFLGGHDSVRTLESYADGKPHGSVFWRHPFMDEAMAYAEQHWPGDLVLDSWTDALKIYLMDPAAASAPWEDEASPVIMLGLNRAWQEIINDHSAPRVSLLNEAIVIASVNPHENAEIRGGRGCFERSLCLACGGDNFAGRRCRTCPWKSIAADTLNTTAPKRVIEVLRESGHAFPASP